VHGAQALKNLQCLDISSNCVSEIGDVRLLTQLRQLSELHLHGNPVSFSQNARARILSLFRHRALGITLDGSKATDPVELLLIEHYAEVAAAEEAKHASSGAGGVFPVSATTSPVGPVSKPVRAMYLSAPPPIATNFTSSTPLKRAGGFSMTAARFVL